MSDPISNLPKWKQDRMNLLITALGNPPMSYAEQASFAIASGLDEITVENLAAVFRRVAQAKRFTP